MTFHAPQSSIIKPSPTGGQGGLAPQSGHPPLGGKRGAIGIYGGSFNPIHNGHIALARSFLTKAALDEVWFIVSPQNPFKVNDTLLDDRKRFLMVEEALKGEPGLVASDYEFSLPRPSYMWNTLQSLSRSYPQHTFTLLIGGDNWAAFDRWYHADDILRTYRIAVYPRRGDTIRQADLPDNVLLLDTELIDISSTEIRQRIAEGLPIDSLVPERIEEKIRREYLVREEGRTKREERRGKNEEGRTKREE